MRLSKQRRWSVRGSSLRATSMVSFAGVLLMAALVPASAQVPGAQAEMSSATATPAPAMRVLGNRLVDPNGNTIRLLGVNRSGTQYACIEGWGIFDGPNDQASVDAMKSWKITAVRVSLNEDCWLAINGVKAKYAGANYQAAIVAYVNLLNSNGLEVIIDLHRAAPGTRKPMDELVMADRDHSPAFWASVAAKFKDNHSVVFDLYNEPFPDNNRNTLNAWRCVRDGGTCRGVSYTAAGSQEMLNAVRGTGAVNPVLVGGPQYAGDVDKWMTYAPVDPAQQLVASIHIYGPDWAPCDYQACWDTYIAPLALKVPVVMGEIGDVDCSHDFIDPLMSWADAHGVSYVAWSWIDGNCSEEPALITNFNGTPTPYGVGLRDHLIGLSR